MSERFYLSRTEDALDLPVPQYMTDGAAGMDLRANVTCAVTLCPGGIALIPTGIKIALPKGFEAQVRPRSGLSLKGISMPNAPGTVDADYRGEIKVPVINLGREDFIISRGDRIAQMVINKVEIVEWEITDINEYNTRFKTERGEDGYGSTGNQ
jgi:dUTP pyrophosphatase